MTDKPATGPTDDKTMAMPAAPDAAAVPPKDPDDDWWENFSKAVEDPNVDIYDYLRGHTLQALDLDNKAGLSDGLVQARQVALRELFSLTDPVELSKKLKALEKNALLFNAQARAIMKVSRAVLDTYVKTRDQDKKGATTDVDMGAAIGASLKEELAEVEGEMNPALESIAASLKDKDEQEVADTIRKAAQQMTEERNLTSMLRDMARFTRNYLKPDNVVNIAIIALPLITWQYRWALALGLGAYSGRHTVKHAYKAAAALYHGDRKEAKAQGREAVKALKAAGGSVLLITLSPVLAKYPLVAAGFLGFAIEAAYNTVLDTFNKMLAEEEKVPGSTPLGRRVKAGVRTFFTTYQDTLAKLTAKTLKALAPHAVTDAIEAVARRMPLSKMKKIAARGWMLSGALATRFNRVAQAKVSAVARELGELRDDVVDAGRDFMKAVEGALSDAAGTAMQRENERLAALIIAEERQRALEAEEARLAAEKEAEKGAEKPAEEAVTEEKAEQGSAAAEFAAKAQGTAQDSAAVKRRKIESMERHRAEEKRQTHTNTMKAKPD